MKNSESGTVVIVGAGLTGASAATTLRAEGFTGRVVLVGDEPSAPYERPPLSKGYLKGDDERDKAFVHPAQWYAQNDVELRLGVSATAIDRGSHRVTLSDGDSLEYSTLLLATGSSPRLLTVPGAELDGVRYLRRIEDADQLRADFAAGPRVVVVGGGWIGLETAAAAREAGLEVTVLESSAVPLGRVLGSEVAEVFATLHREHGVDLRTEVTVTELVGTDGSVSGVRLDDGTVVPAELVIVGIGVTPNVRLAAAAGLAVENGIVVDEHLRTSDPDILAAGDVANAMNLALGWRVRVEHWANAKRHGALAAATLLGRDAIDDRLPYFFTDQYDLGMEYVGHVGAGGYDDVVFRGDEEGREFLVFWLAEGEVLAGMNVNIWDVTEDIEELIKRGAQVDRSRLADPTIPLADV